MDEQSQVWTPQASWGSIGGGTQGGIVAGRLLETAGGEVRAATVHLLHRVQPDVETAVQVLVDRPGGTRSVRTGLYQDDRLVAVAQVLTVPATTAPPVHELVDERPTDGPQTGVPFDGMAAVVPFGALLELRALDAQRPLAGGSDPRLAAWARLRDATALSPLVQLAVLADALPPSTFAVLTRPALLPTVELTLHLVGALPAPGAWVRIDQRTVALTAATVVDDAELRDESGALIALVRQTRRSYPPR